MRKPVKAYVRYHKLCSNARQRYNVGYMEDAYHLWAKAARLRKRMDKEAKTTDIRLQPWISHVC